MDQHGKGELGTHAGNGVQVFVLRAPGRTLPECPLQSLIQVVQLSPQPGDAGAHGRTAAAKWARITAFSASVLANCSVSRAKSRT